MLLHLPETSKQIQQQHIEKHKYSIGVWQSSHCPCFLCVTVHFHFTVKSKAHSRRLGRAGTCLCLRQPPRQPWHANSERKRHEEDFFLSIMMQREHAAGKRGPRCVRSWLCPTQGSRRGAPIATPEMFVNHITITLWQQSLGEVDGYGWTWSNCSCITRHGAGHATVVETRPSTGLEWICQILTF